MRFSTKQLHIFIVLYAMEGLSKEKKKQNKQINSLICQLIDKYATSMTY